MAKMTPSKEDYLRTLLELSEQNDEIHSIEIATILCVSRASVSRMMTILKEERYIAMERYGAVALTESGREIALVIRRRRDILKEFLVKVLGVEEKTAACDACRMEHTISQETTEKLDKKMQRLTDCVKLTGISGEV